MVWERVQEFVFDPTPSWFCGRWCHTHCVKQKKEDTDSQFPSSKCKASWPESYPSKGRWQGQSPLLIVAYSFLPCIRKILLSNYSGQGRVYPLKGGCDGELAPAADPWGISRSLRITACSVLGALSYILLFSLPKFCLLICFKSLLLICLLFSETLMGHSKSKSTHQTLSS